MEPLAEESLAKHFFHLLLWSILIQFLKKQQQCLQSMYFYPLVILDSSKLEEFPDNNFEFDENGRKFLKRVENTVGKEEIACYEKFLLFPQCFLKTYTADSEKTRACLGKG